MKTFGLLCAIAMPLFNIPLIYRIWKRQSSDDMSLVWVIGVWFCMAGMLPSSLVSEDIVLKAFAVMNITLFSGVLIVVILFHRNVRHRFLKR